MSTRIHDLGLVDLALRRNDLTWEHLAKTLDDLIDNMPRESEFFIVARSLELWTKLPTGRTETYLAKLAKKVVSEKLRCIFVLPDNDDPNLKSLVLSDPSQSVQKDVWEHIITTLTNLIDRAKNRNDDDLDHGFVEIYTIPAYVPSTFSKISTKDNIEYCSLEVGIGIPPEEDRVYLYFEKKGNSASIFERLCTIYRNIIAERRPKYKFPSSKNKSPEDRGVLSNSYNRILSDFLKDGFHYSGQIENRDWYSLAEAKLEGEAACVATLPLAKYIGGSKLLDLASRLRQELAAKVSHYPSENTKFTWVPEDDLIVAVFYYKNTFSGFFAFPDDKSSESQDLVSCISAFKPFRIQFKHFVVDEMGRIMLLGFAFEDLLSGLRDKLLELAKISYRRYNA